MSEKPSDAAVETPSEHHEIPAANVADQAIAHEVSAGLAAIAPEPAAPELVEDATPAEEPADKVELLALDEFEHLARLSPADRRHIRRVKSDEPRTLEDWRQALSDLLAERI